MAQTPLAFMTTMSNESSTTNATTAEPEDKPHAPWWVIILITLCFIHLVAGVALANYVRYQKSKALALGKLRKRDRILPTGPPPEKGTSEIIEAATAKEPTELNLSSASGKGPEISAKKSTIAASSRNPVSDKTMSSGDTMRGVSSAPVAEGKLQMPSARAKAAVAKSAVATPAKVNTAAKTAINTSGKKTAINASGKTAMGSSAKAVKTAVNASATR